MTSDSKTDKGWDVYPQLSSDDAFDYARRRRIPRLEQVYDGERLVLREYRKENNNGYELLPAFPQTGAHRRHA